MFLRIMERHPDWAVIAALVGGGQEINDGEAGLAEWGRARADSGLELDWIGLCWGGDLIWSAAKEHWQPRKFRNAGISGWTEMRIPAQREYRRNAYRVLLTRARQGLIIFVPLGAEGDLTRRTQEFEETATFLLACGVKPIPGEEVLPRAQQAEASTVRTSLFHEEV
jgi:hypothetical protein